MRCHYPRLDATIEQKAGHAVAEVGIDLGSAAATLLNTPHDERLATTAVTRSGNALDARRRVFLKAQRNQHTDSNVAYRENTYV